MPRFTPVRTRRLCLAAVTADDLEDLHRLHGDPETYRHAPEARHPDLEHTRSVLASWQDDWLHRGLGYYLARRAEDQALVGCGGVRRSEVNWNVYYRLFPAWWGHGYATELIRAVGGLAELVEPGAILQASIRVSNVASIAVAERLGFVHCGLQLDVSGAEQVIYQLPARELR